MKQVMKAFQPLFDAADKVKADIERSDRIHALGVKLWEQRGNASRGAYYQAMEGAEAIIEEESNNERE